MKGLFSWVTEKASSIYQGAQTVVTTAYDVAGAVYNVLSAGSLNSFSLAWRGFANATFWFNPVPLLSLKSRPNSRAVMLKGTAAALSRLLPVLLYNAGVRPVVGSALQVAHCDYPIVEDAIVKVLDVAAILYFTRNAIRGIADTAACNMAMAEAADKESKVKNIDPSLPHNPMLQSCPHPAEAQLLAGVASSYQYLTSSVVLYMLASSIPYGEWVTLPLFILFNGRALLEVPLAKNCSEHRLEVLNKNNDYAFGVGFSYWLGLKTLQLAAEYGCNARGYFVNEACNAFLYLYFVMANQFTRETPLPGKTVGTDYFYYNRMLADAVVQNIFSWLGEQKGNKYWYATLKTKLRALGNQPAMSKVVDLLVDPELKDWHKAMKRDTAQLYLANCGPGILDGLEFVMDMRRQKFYKNVNSFKNVAPSVMAEDRKKLSLIMDEGLQEPITEWYGFFSKFVDPNRMKQYEERLAQELKEREDNVFYGMDLKKLKGTPELPAL